MKELKTWREVIQALLDGKDVEYFEDSAEKWIKLKHFPNPSFSGLSYAPDRIYRIKPRTIKIGEVDVPEPVRDESDMVNGGEYYFPLVNGEDLCEDYYWSGDYMDLLLLKRGLIHKTKEAAIAHAKALIKISGGSCEN